jgi:glucose-1-phosphate adenylyltransferase
VHGFTEDGTLPGIVEDSIVGSGSVISGGRVERSIIGRGARVNSYSKVTESILMDDVTVGRYAQLNRCIIDKNVVVPEGMKIGFDLEKDRKLFKVSSGGIVVVPKGMDLTLDA